MRKRIRKTKKIKQIKQRNKSKIKTALIIKGGLL